MGFVLASDVFANIDTGQLYRWDTASGRMTAVATGQGAVRRMHFAPPASPALPFNRLPGGATEARLAVLFAGGAFGVWELDSRLDLRQVLLVECPLMMPGLTTQLITERRFS